MSEDLVKNLSTYIKYLETNRPAVLKHPGFPQYISDLERYIQMPGVEARVNFWPCLDDRTTETPMDKYYFYQDTWAAKKIFDIRPAAVVDVGSTALLVGILSQFIHAISIDVRPLPVKLQGLDCKQGSITELPFRDESVELLTSMCVIEHIGLARYGDELDPMGSIKAFNEATRVIRPGGHFIFSVPLSHTPGLLFNAHRIFSKQQVLGLIGDAFSLHDELFLFPEPGVEAQVTRLKDFQYCVWCAHFVKNEPAVTSHRPDGFTNAAPRSIPGEAYNETTYDGGLITIEAPVNSSIYDGWQTHQEEKDFSFSKLFLELYQKYAHELADLRNIEQCRYDQNIFPTTGQYDLFESQILYMLVRRITPVNMIEFSSSSGYSTLFTAMAMQRNAKGTLHTFEINPDSWEATKRNVERFGFSPYAKCILGDVTQCLEPYLKNMYPQPDIFFIDSDHSGRFANWYFHDIIPLLPAGTLVHIHDILPPDHEARIYNSPTGPEKAKLSGENMEVFRFLDQNGYERDVDYIFLYPLSHHDRNWVSEARSVFPEFIPFRTGKDQVIRRMNNRGEYAEWNATIWIRLKKR